MASRALRLALASVAALALLGALGGCSGGSGGREVTASEAERDMKYLNNQGGTANSVAGTTVQGGGAGTAPAGR